MRVFPARIVRDFLVTRDLLLVFHPLPGLRMINHPAASRHPSAEGNFVPRRYWGSNLIRRKGGLRARWDGSSSPIRRKGELFRRGELGMFMSWGAGGGDFQAFLW